MTPSILPADAAAIDPVALAGVVQTVADAPYAVAKLLVVSALAVALVLAMVEAGAPKRS